MCENHNWSNFSPKLNFCNYILTLLPECNSGARDILSMSLFSPPEAIDAIFSLFGRWRLFTFENQSSLTLSAPLSIFITHTNLCAKKEFLIRNRYFEHQSDKHPSTVKGLPCPRAKDPDFRLLLVRGGLPSAGGGSAATAPATGGVSKASGPEGACGC